MIDLFVEICIFDMDFLLFICIYYVLDWICVLNKFECYWLEIGLKREKSFELNCFFCWENNSRNVWFVKIVWILFKRVLFLKEIKENNKRFVMLVCNFLWFLYFIDLLDINFYFIWSYKDWD